MNRLKKTLFAVLGIGVAVAGAWSLLVAPALITTATKHAPPEALDWTADAYAITECSGCHRFFRLSLNRRLTGEAPVGISLPSCSRCQHLQKMREGGNIYYSTLGFVDRPTLPPCLNDPAEVLTRAGITNGDHIRIDASLFHESRLTETGPKSPRLLGATPSGPCPR